MDSAPVRAAAWVRVAVLALLWGSTYLWIELALDAFSPVQVTLVRCLFGSATLFLTLLATGRRLPRGTAVWGRVFVAAFFCNTLPFCLFGVGQLTVGSGLAGVLNATTPLWSLLIGVGLGAEGRLRPVRLTGLVLGFLGTVLIFAPWQQAGSVGWGALAILAAAASYATGFAYMGRHLVGRGISTLSLSTAQLLAATALSVLLLPAGGLRPVDAEPRALIAVVVLGVLATGVSFHLTYRIIADEGATNAATVSYLLPVVAVALGALVLDEDLSPRVIAGMAVVLVGVGLTRRRGPAPPTTEERPPVATAPSMAAVPFEPANRAEGDAPHGRKPETHAVNETRERTT